MIRYLGGILFWGCIIILGEVIKWKAAEQVCMIYKTLALTLRIWMRGF
jgi:hypothetical protein